jgi:REP element-mobilizing transposase RayT
MNRGAARKDVFSDDHDRIAFLTELSEAAVATALEVHAYCLMRNHYHLLLRSREGRLSDGMQRLSSRYTHRFNVRASRDGALFRGRFTAMTCDSDAHVLQALRYIHLNPVEAGLVSSAEDWRWSSAIAYAGVRLMGLTPTGALPGLVTNELLSWFGGDGIRGYREFMAAGIDDKARRRFASLAIGTPMGSDPWV